jgi:hypothetical protein
MVFPSTDFDHQNQIQQPVMGYPKFWKEQEHADLEH